MEFEDFIGATSKFEDKSVVVTKKFAYRLFVLIMSRTRFRVNLHSIVA